VEKTLKILIKRGFNYNFEESLRLMDVDGRRMAREVVRQAMALPIYGKVYRRACRILRIKRSAELAILAVELPLYLPLADLKGLLGLIPG